MFVAITKTLTWPMSKCNKPVEKRVFLLVVNPKTLFTEHRETIKPFYKSDTCEITFDKDIFS